MIRLGALTGARIESLFQLKPENVGVDTKTKIEYLHFADKTEAGDREVPLLPAIKSYLLTRKQHVGAGGFLLPSTAENKYGDRSVPCQKRFGRLKTELGFDSKYTYHSIRKTVATMLDEAGIAEQISADILGHKIRTMTYGVYRGTNSRSKVCGDVAGSSVSER